MRRIPIGVKLTAMILPLVVFLVFIALRTVPQFKITTIKVVAENGKERIPTTLKEQLATYVGLSLFELNLNHLERELSSYPTIKTLKLKRVLPSSLVATISLVESPALVQTTDGLETYLVEENALVRLPAEEIDAWKQEMVTILVPPSYAQMLRVYGLDSSFHQVMELANSLGEKTTLITSIKYDNNSSNSFGKMVLEISSLNAQIWVREPVGTAQIQAAVALAQQDQKDTLSFLSSEDKRYDLYREGLVRRQ
ncbi:MAG: FtsQ-type POTRA domain-containing protein [Sphaerochaetaceae bacterium]|nr:FtsQ-type POTRA domain-containing protein [Sphaerochaetaceae bacterium]